MYAADESVWVPGPESISWALAEAERAIGDAGGLPAGGRLGDRPESIEDRRREDSLFGAAPYEVGDHPGGIRWRDFAVRDVLLINLFETRSAEPTVLLLTQPTASLLGHTRLRNFAAWWLVALGRWALGAGAAVHVGDERPGLSSRGPGQGSWVADRVGGAFREARFDAIDMLPDWATVFAVAAGADAAEFATTLGQRLSGRYGRVYALVAAEDLSSRSRRAIRPAGGSVVLDRPAWVVTQATVDGAIAAGEQAGVAVVPIVVEDDCADYRSVLTRLVAGGPP